MWLSALISFYLDVIEQENGSAGRRYGGAGLGFSLTKKLVAIHDGKIWVDSKGEGKESTFPFTLLV